MPRCQEILGASRARAGESLSREREGSGGFLGERRRSDGGGRVLRLLQRADWHSHTAIYHQFFEGIFPTSYHLLQSIINFSKGSSL